MTRRYCYILLGCIFGVRELTFKMELDSGIKHIYILSRWMFNIYFLCLVVRLTVFGEWARDYVASGESGINFCRAAHKIAAAPGNGGRGRFRRGFWREIGRTTFPESSLLKI